jgi:hypothetical protein
VLCIGEIEEIDDTVLKSTSTLKLQKESDQFCNISLLNNTYFSFVLKLLLNYLLKSTPVTFLIP